MVKKTRLMAASAALVLTASGVLAAAAPAEAASKPIVMTISSSTGSTATVDWYSNFNSATLEDHALPWTKKVSIAGYVHSISASNTSGEVVSLTCTIKYKGKTVRRSTVRGSYARVSCEYKR